MKISLEWLKEFVSIPWSAEALSHRLTMAGLEVESMELGVTPNRGDVLSVLGIAREISALKGKPLKQKTIVPPKGEKPIGDFIRVRNLDPKSCPRYMARGILGVKIADSPDWMQKRLEASGVRPVNNVVDCTNYVMLELGHPLHAFDHRFLKNREVVVRREKGEVKFVTLDGQTRLCKAQNLFICDGEGPLALAGIMGGAHSEIKPDTTNIVLEAACFEPQGIHQTSKHLKLKTESSTRFERGVDPNGVDNALHRVTHLIKQTAGGEPTKDWIDLYPKKIGPKKITLFLSEVERILGTSLSSKRVKKIFESLGFIVRSCDRAIVPRASCVVLVPTYRYDISGPIDLIEEVARLHGYDKIAPTLPKIGMNLPRQPSARCPQAILVETLTGLGFYETCHLSFSSLAEVKPFGISEEQSVFLANPLSKDYEILSGSLMPNLLKALAHNLNRQQKDLRFFECRKIFENRGGEALEKENLAMVVCGNEFRAQWGLPNKPVDFFTLKGALVQLTRGLHVEEPTFEKEPIPFLFSSEACGVKVGGEKVGWMGRLNPGILAPLEIDLPIYALEIEWEAICRQANQVKIHFNEWSKFPYIQRDLALIVEEGISAEDIERAIIEIKNQWIKKVQLFDVFRGANLAAGEKSLAFNILYEDPQRTLTNEEVNQAHQELISHLAKRLNAQLRT